MSPLNTHMKEDRISSLPDCLIHHIFKFLDMKQVIQTTLLSTRWKDLWVSTSHLNFTFTTWPRFMWNDEANCNLFESFVDQVLLRCGRAHPIQTFHLALFHNCQIAKLNAWVTYLISGNVQEVRLDRVQMGESTVRALCGNVKRLILGKVHVLFEEESDELFLSCPIMETLVLNNCTFCEVDDFQVPHVCCNIKLCAPCLKTFVFDGCLSKNYTIQNLSSLDTAVIDVDIWVEEAAEPANLLDNILGGLTNAKSLAFSLNNFPDCSKVPITLNTVATFQSLRYLKLTTWDFCHPSVFCFSTILKLLEKSPNLETFVLEGKLLWEPEFVEENLVGELLSWCKLCHLKTFKIQSEYIAVSECAFKFLKCLMTNATSLQNVVMITSKTSKEKLVNLCKKLKVAPKVTEVSSDRIGVSLKASRKVHWESA